MSASAVLSSQFVQRTKGRDAHSWELQWRRNIPSSVCNCSQLYEEAASYLSHIRVKHCHIFFIITHKMEDCSRWSSAAVSLSSHSATCSSCVCCYCQDVPAIYLFERSSINKTLSSVSMGFSCHLTAWGCCVKGIPPRAVRKKQNGVSDVFKHFLF